MCAPLCGRAPTEQWREGQAGAGGLGPVGGCTLAGVTRQLAAGHQHQHPHQGQGRPVGVRKATNWIFIIVHYHYLSTRDSSMSEEKPMNEDMHLQIRIPVCRSRYLV